MTNPIHPLAGTVEEVRAFEAASAPAAVAVPDERAAFEAWFLQKGSAHQLERNEAKGWYENAWANAGWEAWQARAALAAAPAAPAADELANQLAPLPNRAGTPDLHDKIMNLSAWPSDDTVKHFDNPVIAYKLGHRDARHAAAELVLSALVAPTAAAPVVLPEPALDDAYTRRVIEALHENGDPVSVDAAEEMERLRALLAGVSAPAAQAVVQTPVLYVSKGQLDNHRDPDGPESAVAGRYLPARITPAGKFTTPLFAVPQAPAADALDAATTKPKPGRYVLAWVEGREVPIRAMWVPQYHLEVGDDAPEGFGDYCEEKDEYFCPAGWYEANAYEETHWSVDGKVVAWTELPRRAAIGAQAAAKEGGAA